MGAVSGSKAMIGVSFTSTTDDATTWQFKQTYVSTCPPSLSSCLNPYSGYREYLLFCSGCVYVGGCGPASCLSYDSRVHPPTYTPGCSLSISHLQSPPMAALHVRLAVDSSTMFSFAVVSPLADKFTVALTEDITGASIPLDKYASKVCCSLAVECCLWRIPPHQATYRPPLPA